MAKMELLEQLELVDVQFEDGNQKAVLIFLHEDRGEIREVNFNRQSFDQEKKEFVADPEKAAKVDDWCKEYFDLEFENLGQAIGERKDVYCYENFNSLWEVQLIEKFSEDMLGQIFETTVVNALDDGKKISIQFEYEGNLYESKMQYADYLEARQEWFVNPVKRKKQFDKFAEKFLIPVENISEMIGKTIMVEVKKAYGKFIYSEVKPFKKPKKELQAKMKKLIIVLSGFAFVAVLHGCNAVQSIQYEGKERPIETVEEMLSDRLESENPDFDFEVNITESVD